MKYPENMSDIKCTCTKGNISIYHMTKTVERANNKTESANQNIPYYAPYHGNKLHCDQNVKLGMFGCHFPTWIPMNDKCQTKAIRETE